jgi:ribonucleoside-triphosphate reductase
MNGSENAIDSKISELRKQLQNVEGKETEVYSRIVGYYRSVRNWNKGKKAEYKKRNPYVVAEAGQKPKAVAPIHAHVSVSAAPDVAPAVSEDGFTYVFFFRTTCPNCPPVKDYLGGLTVPGMAVNVDTKEGLAEAIDHQILAAPTVLVLDEAGHEIHRATSVNGLRDFFELRMAVNS